MFEQAVVTVDRLSNDFLKSSWFEQVQQQDFDVYSESLLRYDHEICIIAINVTCNTLNFCNLC